MKKLSLLLAFAIVMTFVLSGCSPSAQDIEDAYSVFGGANAFGSELKNPGTTKTFAIGGTPTGDYRDAAINACNKLNGVSTKVNISYNTNNTTGDWRMRTSTSGDIASNTKGVEYNTSALGNYYVVSSDIVIVSTYCDALTANQKKYIALHEMGHTVGLKDLYNPGLSSSNNKQKAYDYILDNKLTVMLSAYFSKKTEIHALTDYSEYDKRSIKDVFGA